MLAIILLLCLLAALKVGQWLLIVLVDVFRREIGDHLTR